MNIQLNSTMLNNNFKARRQNFGIGSLFLLLFVGAAFMGLLYFILDSTQIDSNWRQTEGRIVDVSSHISDGSTMYTPVIGYTVDGQTFRTTSSFSSASYPSVGDKKDVAYNPARPDQAKAVEGLESTWWLWLFPLIGVILVVAAPILFVRSRKRSKIIDALIQSGQKLQGILVDVQSYGGQGNATYKIVVAATRSDGVVQNYESDNISGIGGLALTDFRNTPIPIDVYIDAANPQNYYVDVSDIPNLTPERITQLLQSVVKPERFQPIMNAQPPQNISRPSNNDPRPPTPTI